MIDWTILWLLSAVLIMVIPACYSIYISRHKIRYTRKKLKDVYWRKSRIRELLERSTNLNSYRKFKCSEFFVGAQVAERNTKWYYKEINKVDRRLNFLENYGKSTL